MLPVARAIWTRRSARHKGRPSSIRLTCVRRSSSAISTRRAKTPHEAVAAYEAAQALEPNEALERKVETLREGIALAAMPMEFQAIESSPLLSREQLAALVGVRLDGLFKRTPRPNAVVITDTRGSWAVPWIMSVTRAGVMEVYPNHTFQPGAVVRRGDLGGSGEPRAVAHCRRKA